MKILNISAVYAPIGSIFGGDRELQNKLWGENHLWGLRTKISPDENCHRPTADAIHCLFSTGMADTCSPQPPARLKFDYISRVTHEIGVEYPGEFISVVRNERRMGDPTSTDSKDMHITKTYRVRSNKTKIVNIVTVYARLARLSKSFIPPHNNTYTAKLKHK